mmetsp:Transcript_82679/g.256635  ORF Transcript_82679/g.256635 Transcript_82679/m.256635 type:complete len:289 (-) Transcript_82679:183-1049(-)
MSSRYLSRHSPTDTLQLNSSARAVAALRKSYLNSATSLPRRLSRKPVQAKAGGSEGTASSAPFSSATAATCPPSAAAGASATAGPAAPQAVTGCGGPVPGVLEAAGTSASSPWAWSKAPAGAVEVVAGLPSTSCRSESLKNASTLARSAPCRCPGSTASATGAGAEGLAGTVSQPSARLPVRCSSAVAWLRAVSRAACNSFCTRARSAAARCTFLKFSKLRRLSSSSCCQWATLARSSASLPPRAQASQPTRSTAVTGRSSIQRRCGRPETRRRRQSFTDREHVLWCR